MFIARSKGTALWALSEALRPAGPAGPCVGEFSFKRINLKKNCLYTFFKAFVVVD